MVWPSSEASRQATWVSYLMSIMYKVQDSRNKGLWINKLGDILIRHHDIMTKAVIRNVKLGLWGLATVAN